MTVWHMHFAGMSDGVQQANRALSRNLSAGDTDALKQFTRDLVWWLHPDANLE